MTDPIADMLTRLRNANSAYHDSVEMPHSKIKSHIAEILQQEGYITGWKTEDAQVGKSLVLELKFGPNFSSRTRFLPTSASSTFQPVMKPSCWRISAM
jgi:ribosomal protein S8